MTKNPITPTQGAQVSAIDEARLSATKPKPFREDKNSRIIYHEFRWHLIVWALAPLVTAIGTVIFMLSG